MNWNWIAVTIVAIIALIVIGRGIAKKRFKKMKSGEPPDEMYPLW